MVLVETALITLEKEMPPFAHFERGESMVIRKLEEVMQKTLGRLIMAKLLQNRWVSIFMRALVYRG